MNSLDNSQIDTLRRRGRGAISNHSNRFERFQHVESNDGWDIEEQRPRFHTEVRQELARKLISYNRSPDLPFDRSINPYRGCEHGCIYCFARPSHAYLGMSPGLDFETRLVARINAPEILQQELSARRYQVAPIAIGTNTDPYQPIEKDHQIMRRLLQVLRDYKHPVAIVTKGSLIERDLDILTDMAAEGLVRVGVSLTSLDPKLSRAMEPRVPTPQRRLATIRALTAAGVPVRVMTSPIVPAVNDHEIEALLQAAADAGADAASWIMLRLPREVSGLFQEWLLAHFPQRAGKVMKLVREMHDGKDYAAQWGRRMRGQGQYADLIAARFARAAAALGLDQNKTALRCDLFRQPPRAGDQLSLF